MDLVEYLHRIRAIGFGKKLPTALYVWRGGEGGGFGKELDQMVVRLMVRYEIGPEFNVIKFRTDELKISFLCYPRFFEDPHPPLRHAMTIDLVRGKVRHMDYASNPNPPILHRKEAFLPAGHPMRALFTALTEAEEVAGLYTDTTTIGFKLNWDRLLASKELRYGGHRLLPATVVKEETESPTHVPVVERHKTALVRYELSKPVRTLLEYGQIRTGVTFFDYGCGQGTDVTGLRNLGYAAEGWDPVHRTHASKSEADVVNLGYVLNVIEDPAERLETIVEAFRYSRRLLVVSALIRETVDAENAQTFRDGVLTKRNTFQKYFEQQELQQYIEDALDTTAVPVALGVFYVFRNPVEQQDFIEARTRRTIDWTQICTRLGLGQPRKSRWEAFYEQHKELLDVFWATVLRLGRIPAPEEFSRHAELREVVGSPKRALRLFVKQNGPAFLEHSAATRRNDLLVYMAMSNLRKRVPLGHLSASLRLDIRTFLVDHKRALAKGLELLYAAGDPGEIELACEGLKVGWQDEQALHLHRSLLEQLPPVLRVYVGCATALFGDVQQADLIKLHKASGKVTFLTYDDFENKPLPELRARIKVNLRTRWVELFDHTGEGQLLYFKERFVAPGHPKRAEMEKFGAKLRKLGFTPESIGMGPLKANLVAFLTSKGLNENLNARRRPGSAVPTGTQVPERA